MCIQNMKSLTEENMSVNSVGVSLFLDCWAGG
jgi:hypothetical protein